MKTFRGESISSYVKDITDLCISIYAEYPYLYEGTEEEYLPFIEHYTQSKNGIACILFDHEKPIGIAIGMPMNEMREKYKHPFVNARPKENCEELFYLGEFLLLKDYRGQGLGKQMYSELEHLVKEYVGLKKICFCKIDETNQNPLKPENYKALDGFWAKLGFDKCDDINVTVYWRNVCEDNESPHQLVYWLKSLSSD
jgi:GNAT superfamily N-acetyltransferase